MAGRLRMGCQATAWLALVAWVPSSFAQVAEPLPEVETVEPLGNLQPPGPDPNKLAAIVKNKTALVVLGKALFWDTAVGGDGQACASCHFNAGADPRVVNQLNPALRAVPGDATFGGVQPVTPLTRGGLLQATGKKAGPNVKLDAKDFPFHQLKDPGNRQSQVLYSTNDVFSSQGVFQGTFIGLNREVKVLGGTKDFCKLGTDGIFEITIGGVKRQVRKVEPRNTPTMINAAFFHRNFWDGRANNIFNGVSPFGRRDPGAFIFKPPATADGPLQAERLELENSSLASQAVGPPGSDFEMACAGRSFADIGRKVLPRTALAGAKISTSDGVLGPLVRPGDNRGLTLTYDSLVQQAFRDELWNAPGTYDASGAVSASGYTQRERNFSLFWGLAIEAYERTLISNQTPFDKGTMTAQQQAGLEVFTGPGKCVACHVGPLFSGAAIPPRQPNQLVERMIMGDGGTAFYDGGFYNIGVRQTQNDVGVGGKDDWGNPLSFTRQHVSGVKVDPFEVDPNTFEVPCSATSPCNLDQARVAVDGAFKTPSLRNVALTAPYFHNGGEATLASVVEFYNRGGNRCGQNGNDTTGTGPLGQGFGPLGPVLSSQCQNTLPAPHRGSNLDPDVQSLGLTATQKADLVAFMKALTDDRVRCHRAPFDHPELFITNGQKLTSAGERAADAKLRLREVGRNGYASAACAPNSGDLFTYNVIGVGKMLEVVP